MTAALTIGDESGTGARLPDKQDRKTRHLRLVDGSTTKPTLSEEDLARGSRFRDQQTDSSANRLALLGLLMAQLEGLTFEEVSTVLDVAPRRLERMLHGEESVPTAVEPRWEAAATIVTNLHEVLRPDATGQWFRTPIPRLSGRTPLDAARRDRRLGSLQNLTRSYLDPAFG